MESRKKNFKVFIEGAESAFDLTGSGFSRKRNTHVIEESWQRVGMFFVRGMEMVKEHDESTHSEKNGKALEHSHG